MRTGLILRLQAISSKEAALPQPLLPGNVALSPSPHCQNSAQIICSCAGRTRHHIGTPRCTVELSAGDLLLLPPRTPYSMELPEKIAAKPGSETSLAIGISFSPEFFSSCALRFQRDPLGEFLLNSLRRGGSFPCLPVLVGDCLPVRNLMELLLSDLAFPQPGGEEIVQVTAELLLMQIFSRPELFPPETRIMPVLKALAQIRNHYPCADLTRLSEELHMSLPSLSSAVHGATGRTFKELLLEKRLEEAARLLAGTSLPVEEIISAVGYDNTSYFYRRFRQRFGVSPRLYRKSFETSHEISD